MGATRGHMYDLEWTYHSTTTSPEIPYFEPKIGLINQTPQCFVARTNFFFRIFFCCSNNKNCSSNKKLFRNKKQLLGLLWWFNWQSHVWLVTFVLSHSTSCLPAAIAWYSWSCTRPLGPQSIVSHRAPEFAGTVLEVLVVFCENVPETGLSFMVG